MGRTVRERDLSTRETRKSLAVRNEPYWRNEGEGRHLGYYRGARVAKWVARYREPGTKGGYLKKTLGEADDSPGCIADGKRFLSWRHAKDQAVKWFEEMERAGGVRLQAYTVSDALDDYLKKFTKKDLANTRRRIEVFIRPALGSIELAQLTTKQIEDWHHERANAPARIRTSKKAVQKHKADGATVAERSEAYRRRQSTANRDLTVLKAALNKTVEGSGRKAHSDIAWRSVKPFKDVERAKLRYLSDDEARRLVNACDASFRPMVQGSLLTGARYQELARARVVDFDAKAGTLRLTETKSGKPRHIYLEAEGVELFRTASLGKMGDAILLARPDGLKWNDSQQARPMLSACKAAKIAPAVSFHDLRRTYGARLAMQGVPMAVIAQALGHADERITSRHYAHLHSTYVAAQVREHAAGLGIVQKSDVARLGAA